MHKFFTFFYFLQLVTLIDYDEESVSTIRNYSLFFDWRIPPPDLARNREEMRECIFFFELFEIERLNSWRWTKIAYNYELMSLFLQQ